jgi:hypothetical protein
MTDEIINERRRAADSARDYLSGKLSWDQFMELFAHSDDDLIGDLVTLIEHEPQRGGLLGVNERDWSEYQSQVSSAIVALET